MTLFSDWTEQVGRVNAFRVGLMAEQDFYQRELGADLSHAGQVTTNNITFSPWASSIY